MPDEIKDFARAAQEQSQAFLRESRQNMVQQLQEQRAQLIGIAPGTAGRGGGQYPQPGTPAGRLLETITDLVRSGAGMAAGAGAAAARPLALPFQGAGAAAGYMVSGQGAFGPSGIQGGMFLDRREQMGFMGTAFTAYGQQMFGDYWGRYAAQRMDMTRQQASVMAKEEMSYRVSGGVRGGLYGAANVASLGMLGMGLRRQGRYAGLVGIEDMTRQLQAQMRYVTGEDLAAGGMGGEAGPFATGITRAGARKFQRALLAQIPEFEAQFGLEPEEISTVQSRAMGTMGTGRISQLVRQGPQAFGVGVGGQMRSVRDIQQILHLSGEEATSFFKMVGQIHGTAERIAKIARESRAIAGRGGLNVRDVTNTLLEFERTGIQMGVGAGRARNVAAEFLGNLRAQERAGVIGREEMFAYGGNTFEEALAAQARTRFQQNVGAWQRGGMLTGMGILATRDPGSWGQFMAGGMNPMQVMGAAGGVYARRPFAGLEAQFDPAQTEMMGVQGGRATYMMARGMMEGGMLVGDQQARRAQAMEMFRGEMGLTALDARRRWGQYGREQRWARQVMGEGAEDGSINQVWGIYGRLVGQNMTGFAMEALGKSDPMQAAALIYQNAKKDANGNIDPTSDLLDLMRPSIPRQDPRRRGRQILRAAGRMAQFGRGGRYNPVYDIDPQREGQIGAAGRVAGGFFNWLSGTVLGQETGTLEEETAAAPYTLRDIKGGMRAAMGNIQGMRKRLESELGYDLGEEALNEIFLARGGAAVTVGGRSAKLIMQTGGRFGLRMADGSIDSIDSAGLAGKMSRQDGLSLLDNVLRKSIGRTEGGWEDILTRMSARGDLAGGRRDIYNQMILRRYGGMIGNLGFGDLAKPGAIRGVMRGVAGAFQGGEEQDLYGRMGVMGMEGLRTYARIYDIGAEGMRATGGNQLAAFQALFGENVSDRLASIFEAQGVTGFTKDRIGKILSDRVEDPQFQKALESWGVSKEIFLQALRISDTTKVLQERGTELLPMVVKPDMESWKKLGMTAGGSTPNKKG